MNGNVDPRIDKMMAYLYGELPEAEERAFHRLLEKDDVLRAEYEELSETRLVLGGWEVEERVPSFVLVEGAAADTAPRRAGALAKILEPFRGFAVTPAWGLAAAALILLVLAVNSFRIEKVDGGVALRFGEPTDPATSEVATTTPAGQVPAPAPSGLPLGIPVENLGVDPLRDRTTAMPVGAYLTQDDLRTYDENLILMLSQLLNAYSEKRDREITEGFQSFYQQVNSRQDHDYEQLAGRIDILGRELLLESDRSARGFQEILSQPQSERLPTGTEED